MVDPLLGRHGLEALCLNTRKLLAEAADRFSGSIDMERLIGSFAKKGDGRVSRVMEEFFHAADEDDDNEGEWCDIGDETTDEWETSLSKNLAQAKAKGMTVNGMIALEEILREHQHIVRVRFNGGPPARIRPFELRIVEGAHPIRENPRRCAPKKRQFLRRYVSELETLGLMKKAVRIDWLSAPLVVQKNHRHTIG